MLNRTDRSKLGHSIRSIFESSYPGEKLDKIKSIEENGQPFTVNNYPDHFTPQIDIAIKTYYRELLASHKAKKEASANETPQRKIRARKSTKKPIYRASSNNPE